MAVAEAQLKEFLQRSDVPDEDKAKAVELYDKARAAAPTEAPAEEVPPAAEAPSSPAGALIGETVQNQQFDPGGSAHARKGEAEIGEGVQGLRGTANTKALIARTALPIVGGIIGAATPIPGGAAIGAGLGAAAGDWIAQESEIDSGLRQAYNPFRTGAEVITAGYFSKFQAGKTLMQAAVRGGLGNMASDTFINLTEGKGLPSTFELAVSGLTGGILSGAGHKGGEMWHARKAAALEITGSDEVATRLANFMGPTQAGEQLEFKLKAQPKQLELQSQFANEPPGIPMRREVGPTETIPPGAPTPEPPMPELVGPTITPTAPGPLKKGAAARGRLEKKWSDQQLTEQFGFDDLEEGRTFEKILGGMDGPDNYSLNLKEADKAKPAKVAQITQSEQDEWARMKALAGGKKEMLDTPLDRDPTFGDVSPVTNSLREPLSKARTGTTEGVRSIGRIKDVFKRLEMDHDFPVYQDYHDASQAYRKAQTDVSRDAAVAAQGIEGTSKVERTAIMQAFMNGGDFSQMPRKLQAKATKLWDTAGKQLAEYDLTPEEYFSEYLPQVASGKSMKQIIEEGSATSMIPKRLRFAEDAAGALLSPQDPSLIRIMNKLIDVGAYRRHVADIGADLSLKYGAESTAPKAIKQEMQKYLASLKGSTGDPSAETVSNVFGMITGRLGMDMTGTELANKLIGMTYTGLMGWRPSSVIRNAMQTIQTGIPLYGVKSFTAGLKGAFTEEGRAIARAAGVIDEGNVLHDLARGKLQEPGTNLVSRGIRKVVDSSFTPFQFIENQNRTISYLAGLDKFDRAMGKASKATGRASWKTLMDKADIDQLSEPEIKVLSKMWDAGEPLDKIRHTYAQGIVDDTQFMYLLPERARVLQSQSGRMALGYANWSQGYASYMARMVGQGPPRKRVRQTAMFLGTNSVLAGTFAAVGGMFGDQDGWNDALGWTFAGPLFYGGGPILTTAQSISENVRKNYQGQTKPETLGKGLSKDLSVFLPMGGVTRDIFAAAEESTPSEMAGRFLGFKRGKK